MAFNGARTVRNSGYVGLTVGSWGLSGFRIAGIGCRYIRDA